MRGTSGLESLFSQQLDRALFATYFLGAVVPLLAVGYLVQRYALPTVQDDGFATSVVLGLAVGIMILSLASFLALRKLSLDAVARMNADNDRLAAILDASRELSSAPHVHAAASVAAGCALRLAPDHTLLIMRRPAVHKDWELCESAGRGAQGYVDEHPDAVSELAELAVSGPGGPTQTLPVGDRVGMAIPMYTEGAPPAALVVLTRPHGRSAENVFPKEVVDALCTLAGLAAVAMQSAEVEDSQRNFFTHATEIMVAALDAHQGQRTGGCHVVAKLSSRIGRELGLEDEETLRRLHFGALLADIGMLKLSSAQQRSPQHVARHAALGHRMLSRIRMWEPLAEIVRHHHDSFDGSGGPESLRADAIPVESRIIHVADAFACMTHGGDGATARTPVGALEAIVAEAGVAYDPRVVQALHRLVDRGEVDV